MKVIKFNKLFYLGFWGEKNTIQAVVNLGIGYDLFFILSLDLLLKFLRNVLSHSLLQCGMYVYLFIYSQGRIRLSMKKKYNIHDCFCSL